MGYDDEWGWGFGGSAFGNCRGGIVIVGVAVLTLFCCMNSLIDGSAEGVGCGNGLAVYVDRDENGGGLESGMRDTAACGRIAHMAGTSLCPGGGLTYCCCFGGGECGGGG